MVSIIQGGKISLQFGTVNNKTKAQLLQKLPVKYQSVRPRQNSCEDKFIVPYACQKKNDYFKSEESAIVSNIQIKFAKLFARSLYLPYLEMLSLYKRFCLLLFRLEERKGRNWGNTSSHNDLFMWYPEAFFLLFTECKMLMGYYCRIDELLILVIKWYGKHCSLS